MDIFQASVLGAVEGFTEFLPISSTGHMMIAAHAMSISQSDAVKSFEIIIQSGAIAAVIGRYWRQLLDVERLKVIMVAFMPTAIIGFTLYPLVKSVLLGNLNIVGWALIIGGVVMVLFELAQQKKPTQVVNPDMKVRISYPQAIMVGLAQSAALIPGVSRSAATIIGGQMVGISRSDIVDFSFLLAVPTLLAATGLDLLKNYHDVLATDPLQLGVGFLVAFAMASLSISFLLAFIKRFSFIPFGVYRIVVGALLLYMLS